MTPTQRRRRTERRTARRSHEATQRMQRIARHILSAERLAFAGDALGHADGRRIDFGQLADMTSRDAVDAVDTWDETNNGNPDMLTELAPEVIRYY